MLGDVVATVDHGAHPIRSDPIPSAGRRSRVSPPSPGGTACMRPASARLRQHGDTVTRCPLSTSARTDGSGEQAWHDAGSPGRRRRSRSRISSRCPVPPINAVRHRLTVCVCALPDNMVVATLLATQCMRIHTLTSTVFSVKKSKRRGNDRHATAWRQSSEVFKFNQKTKKLFLNGKGTRGRIFGC